MFRNARSRRSGLRSRWRRRRSPTRRTSASWHRASSPPATSRMDNAELLELTAIPVSELRGRARTRFRLVRDIPALLDDFADSILTEVREAALSGTPARLILPVGPVAQYKRVVEVSNHL